MSYLTLQNDLPLLSPTPSVLPAFRYGAGQHYLAKVGGDYRHVVYLNQTHYHEELKRWGSRVHPLDSERYEHRRLVAEKVSTSPQAYLAYRDKEDTWRLHTIPHVDIVAPWSWYLRNTQVERVSREILYKEGREILQQLVVHTFPDARLVEDFYTGFHIYASTPGFKEDLLASVWVQSPYGVSPNNDGLIWKDAYVPHNYYPRIFLYPLVWKKVHNLRELLEKWHQMGMVFMRGEPEVNCIETTAGVLRPIIRQLGLVCGR